jgi:hypothetical protein
MKHHDPAMDEPIPGAAEVEQAYNELPSLDVPSELDARILARARKATNKSNKVVSMQLAGIRRWAIPLSTAASVIVVLSVVYETQFNKPHEPVAAAISEGDVASPAQHAPAAAAPSPGEVEPKPVSAGSKQASNAARGKVIQPTQPSIGPPASPVVVPPPVVVSMAEPASATPAFAPPPPPSVAARSEQMAMADANVAKERSEDKKEQESKAAVQVQANAKLASGSVMALAKPAEAIASAALNTLAGHYNYVAYRIVTLSGEVLGLKEWGYVNATLDISAQGTFTRRMTAADGKVTTQTAKVIEAKLDGRHGEWTVLWSDMSYPVQSNFGFASGKIVSRTQFEEMSDSAHFGSVEQATLQR